MIRLRDQLTWGARIRYIVWRLLGSRETLAVRLKRGGRICVRPAPSLDLDIAREIFALGCYRLPNKISADTVRNGIRNIVDLGSNVGLSLVFWSHEFRNARIFAYEPHPAHLRQLQLNVQINGLQNRVVTCPVAAGVAPATLFLTDEGPRSTLSPIPAPHALQVEVVDWFEDLAHHGLLADGIDLLKIDIEGGEFVLLADPRFAELAVRNLVLEWHDTRQRKDGQSWCLQRLESLGFRCQLGQSDSRLIWATRD